MLLFAVVKIIILPIIGVVSGVLIKMFYKDHNPPHFHTKYGGDKAVFDLDGNLLKGKIPKNKRKKVEKWAKENKDYIKNKWDEFS